MNKYLAIQIKSSDSIDTYYFNLETGKFCVKKGEIYVELPERIQERILGYLPNVSYKDLPDKFIELMNGVAEKAYRLPSGIVKGGNPNLLVRLFNPGIEFLKRYTLVEPEVKETQLSFHEMVLNGVKYDFDTSKNSEDIKGSIKNLLTKLKENDDGTVNIPRIKLSDGIFYASSTPEKKEIDPFFKDPDIIKYLDLSGIDFTNADITFSCLAYSGAKIVLKDLYNKSIEGADLEGVSLHGQDLDDINANNANLVKTGIFVSLERTSVIGAKFSSSSTFMMGINVLSYEQVVSMGIDIINESEEIELKQKL